MKRLLRDVRFWACGLFTLAIVLVAALAPWLSPYSHDAMNSAFRMKGPGGPFWLGTDEFGRDVLSRLIYGARLTLIVSLGSIAIAAVAGTALGLLAGYYGRWVEQVIMRLMDAILSFPPILLAIFVVVFLGPKLLNVILTIGVLYVPRFARVVHGVTLAGKQNDYVEAARALGAPAWRVLLRGILPNVAAPVIVQMSLGIGNAVLLESGLSFLGLGPPPPAPSWGRMIEQSARFMHLNAHAVIWPSLVISATVLAFNILGDAVRDALDPRLKA